MNTPLHIQLKRLRFDYGLTQAEAARRFGVSRWTWNQWESGAVRPTKHRDALDALLMRYQSTIRAAGAP